MRKYSEAIFRLIYMAPPHTPLPQQYISKDLQHLNIKSEAGRRLTFEEWPVAFMDKNNLVIAGFY
jgi:hypothetical protein